MTHPNPSTALARVVVDELVARGVRLVVVSPGSRSAALAIAAVEHDDLETRVVIDERSAAFHALGAARASGLPTAVLATSGTAPANFFPAVVEADMSCVPLIAISADRPAEMRGVGANQTIDQVELFGGKVRGYAGIEAPDAPSDANRRWRTTVADMVGRALSPRPGPVHLNVAFREPTVPVADDGRSVAESYPHATPRLEHSDLASTHHLPLEIPAITADRGLVIAGDGDYERQGLLEEATRLGWPVLATALSGLRGEQVVGAYHRTLRSGIPGELSPEVVVAVGAIGPDPVLEDLVAVACDRIRVDAWGRTMDPRRNATAALMGDPVELLGKLSASPGPDWARSWLEADERAKRSVDDILGSRPGMSGGSVAAALNEIEWGSLVVASSLPIREVDVHLRRGGAVFGNRGASGIDGFVSTSLGAASVIPGTLALSGDLSFLHDSNGFLHDAEIDLTMVVIDNRGGGLFDSLPPSRHAPDYERLFVTDPKRDLAALARWHGARAEIVADSARLIAFANEALDRGGVDVIVVPVDRAFDLEMRGQALE